MLLVHLTEEPSCTELTAFPPLVASPGLHLLLLRVALHAFYGVVHSLLAPRYFWYKHADHSSLVYIDRIVACSFVAVSCPGHLFVWTSITKCLQSSPSFLTYMWRLVLHASTVLASVSGMPLTTYKGLLPERYLQRAQLHTANTSMLLFPIRILLAHFTGMSQPIPLASRTLQACGRCSPRVTITRATSQTPCGRRASGTTSPRG